MQRTDEQVRITAGHLADGRELFYFDYAGAPERDTHDPRDLPPIASSSEARYDPLLDEWVAIASHRQARIFQPPSAGRTAECPLCPSHDGQETEIPASDYAVAVFENRFPSFSQSATSETDPLDDGLVPRRPARGRCEVVCFTSDHDASFGSLPPERVRLVIDAWAERTAALAALPGVAHVFPFENRGEEIGVTLAHPHGQIYAYPFVPPKAARMMENVRRHRERTGQNLFDQLVAAERAAGLRVVAENDTWTAFVPAFARWPFEVHLHPLRRVGALPDLDEAQRDGLATLFLDVLHRFDGLFGRPLPYIAAWMQAPVAGDEHSGCPAETIAEAALHLQLFSIRRAADKLKYLAGSESGMGAFISDVPPERAAQMLRDAG